MNKITFFNGKLNLIYNLFFITSIFYTSACIAQDRVLINGRILVPNGNSSEILVVNLVTEKETRTNWDGDFLIEVKEDDLLIFSSEHTEFTRKIVEKEEVLSQSIILTILPKIVSIDEVEIIQEHKFDAVSLGILSKPAKVYTKGQRIMKSNTGFVEGITKLFNPKIKERGLRIIDTEREISYLEKLEKMFDEEYYINYYNLKPEQIRSFQLYVITKKEIKTNISLNNKFLVAFFMSEFSTEFLKMKNE